MNELCVRYIPLLYYLLAGLLLGAGFIHPPFWTLGFFGVALFIFAVKNTQSWKAVLLGGVLTWTVKSLFPLYFFWSVNPSKLLEVSLGSFELYVIFVYWSTGALFLSLGGALVAGAIKIFDIYKVPVIFGFFLFPILWVAGEVVSAYSFSIWTLGPGATINSAFSFGYLGYLFGQHETLLLAAKIAGVYGLSALGALLGYSIWFTLTEPINKKMVAAVFVGVTLLWVSRGDVSPISSTEGSGQTVVAVIDTQFSNEWLRGNNRYFYKMEQVQQAVRAALLLRPDYILLPEDSRFTNASIDVNRAYNLFRFQNSDPEVVLIDSGRTPLTHNTASLRAYIYDGISKEGFITDKQYLVPQGEFVPHFYNLGLQALGFSEVATKLRESVTFMPGPESSQAHFPTHVPGILFCFESVDPLAARRLIKEREVPFIAHPISHAWFNESEILWQQQDVMLKMQALWSGTPIVSAANMAQGALYTKEGKKVLPAQKFKGEHWVVGLVSW